MRHSNENRTNLDMWGQARWVVASSHAPSYMFVYVLCVGNSPTLAVPTPAYMCENNSFHCDPFSAKINRALCSGLGGVAWRGVSLRCSSSTTGTSYFVGQSRSEEIF